MTIWRMRITCWIPNVTNTHPGYVTFIALPLQQWLHECASMLCYTYTGCIVIYVYKEYALPFYICIHGVGWPNVSRNM